MLAVPDALSALPLRAPQIVELTMCANYQPVTRVDRLLTYFGVERAPGEVSAPEIWPLGLAPFIRLHEDGSGNKIVQDGLFGLLPHFAKELAYGRRTYNARSETIHQLPSFRDSWAHARRCVIPAEAIFEPCYVSGKAVRWCIRQPGDVPMGIAGVYRQWRGPDGRVLWTFAMITINAKGHPVFQRLHAPGEEKRMVTILHPQEYDRWLRCTTNEAVTFFTQWQGPLEAFPAPLPPRGRKAG